MRSKQQKILGVTTFIYALSIQLGISQTADDVNHFKTADRLQLHLSAEQQQIRITPSEDGAGITLKPVSKHLLPVRYEHSSDLVSFRRIREKPHLDNGQIQIAIDASPYNARFFRASFPAWTGDDNPYLRVPVRPAQPATLTMVIHGDTGVRNAGLLYESLFKGSHEWEGTYATYPTAPDRNSGTAMWRGQNANDDDYKHMLATLAAADHLVSFEARVLIGISRGAEAAMGMALLYPQRVDRLVIYAGRSNENIANYVAEKKGSAPLAGTSVPTVVISSIKDELGLHPKNIKIAQTMAKAHGFEGEPTKLDDKIDLHEKPVGPDTEIWQYGPHVVHLVSTAPSHEDTFILSEPAGFITVNNQFVQKGVLPGSIP